MKYVQGKARVIVVNSSYTLAPWADLLYACDLKWWEHYKPEFAGIKVTQAEAYMSVDMGLNRVIGRPGMGLSFDPSFIHFGNNSGYQAINLAFHLTGGARTFLLGFDMKLGKKSHWHGDHGGKLSNPTQTAIDGWLANFDAMARDANVAGFEIVNCSRDTALTCFRRSTIQEALR